MTVNHFRKRSVIFLMNNKLHSIQINKCPFCGGTEFVYGYQSEYGAVTGNESLMSWQVLRHVICRSKPLLCRLLSVEVEIGCHVKETLVKKFQEFS